MAKDKHLRPETKQGETVRELTTALLSAAATSVSTAVSDSRGLPPLFPNGITRVRLAASNSLLGSIEIEIEGPQSGASPSSAVARPTDSTVADDGKKDPEIVNVDPNHGTQGTEVPVVIHGKNFGEPDLISFGFIDVRGSKPKKDGNEKLTTTVAIDADATLGNRDVTVSFTDGKFATLVEGFTVMATNQRPSRRPKS